MTDKLDAAIRAAAAAAEPAITPVPIELTLRSTGRPIALVVPSDLTGGEAMDLIAWLAAPDGLRAHLAAQRPPLAVARTLPT